MAVVSVIIPTFNRAQKLMRAISSVLDQSFSHYEILVVDDGSTDETKTALAQFGDRIRQSPLVPWAEFLPLLNSLDINLAPLEPENPFCRSKSEIKYTEAALLGIPTVASRIDALEYAIREGTTGFLAGTTDEWVTALERLVTDPEGVKPGVAGYAARYRDPKERDDRVVIEIDVDRILGRP